MRLFDRIWGTLSLSLAILCLSSCNQQSGGSMFKVENKVEFDTINLIARHHLDSDTLNPYCDIALEFIYPVSSSNMQLDQLQQFFIRNTLGAQYDTLAPDNAAQQYVRNYIDNYIADAKTYRESSDEIDKINNIISGADSNDHADHEHYHHDARERAFFYSYYERLSDSIVYNQHEVISFQVKQSNNKGGASSYNSYRNYVLNLQTGKQVTENDIFNAGYNAVLQDIIISSLLEQNKVEAIEELEDLGFFGVREIMPNQNFLLNEKGIIYTYNKGEYSAYQLDAPEIFIPYQSLISLLKENSIAAKLANL